MESARLSEPEVPPSGSSTCSLWPAWAPRHGDNGPRPALRSLPLPRGARGPPSPSRLLPGARGVFRGRGPGGAQPTCRVSGVGCARAARRPAQQVQPVPGRSPRARESSLLSSCSTAGRGLEAPLRTTLPANRGRAASATVDTGPAQPPASCPAFVPLNSTQRNLRLHRAAPCLFRTTSVKTVK